MSGGAIIWNYYFPSKTSISFQKKVILSLSLLCPCLYTSDRPMILPIIWLSEQGNSNWALIMKPGKVSISPTLPGYLNTLHSLCANFLFLLFLGEKKNKKRQHTRVMLTNFYFCFNDFLKHLFLAFYFTENDVF